MAASMSSTLSVFQAAVERVLEGWTVLQLAVQHGFGGRDSQAKAQWLPGAIATWFSENNSIERDEVEDFLSDILDTEFTTVADDGSLPEVAGKICSYWRLCESGQQEAVMREVQALPRADTSSSQRHQTVGEDDSDDDDESPPDAVPIQPQQNQQPAPTPSSDREEAPMEEEDDGWTVVARSKNR